MPFINDDTIVINPEILHGNFLNAKNVVRWLLFFNRFPNDDTAYGKNDLFFSYSKKFNDPELNPSGRICTVSYFNWEIYKRTNFGERNGTCYIVRKGRSRPDLPREFDGPILDSLPEREKAKYFNSCKYCVSYDTYTAYSSIAAMLGCISIIVPEPGKTKENYGGERPGIAFSFDDAEIEAAIASLPVLTQRFAALEQSNRENVRFFIEECRKYFGML